MVDIGGLILLIVTLVGAIKWLWMPLWIPQIVALAALSLMIYQGAFKRSRFALVHTATLWVALTWIAGHLMEQAMGNGLLMQIPLWIMLLLTPAIVVVHQLIQVRFSPTASKNLKLTRTETTPFKDWLNSRQKKDVAKKIEMEVIAFDLGEEIEFKNKSS